jgi:hypothetical protein
MTLEEINKKRKLAAEPGGSGSASPALSEGGKKKKVAGERFQRIKMDDVSYHDQRLMSNAFDTKVCSSLLDPCSCSLLLSARGFSPRLEPDAKKLIHSSTDASLFLAPLSPTGWNRQRLRRASLS